VRMKGSRRLDIWRSLLYSIWKSTKTHSAWAVFGDCPVNLIYRSIILSSASFANG
jgi:hypothetical protein